MAKAKCDDEKLDLMACAYLNGLSIYDVAKLFGYKDASHVSRLLKAHGVAVQRRPPSKPALLRFLEKVPNRPEGECWLWVGSERPNNRHATEYGGFKISKEEHSVPAHVAAYRLFKGAVPEGALVRHTCDVRKCVNPGHLLLGSEKDNMRDAVDRGRIANGERQGLSVMTEQKVRELRTARKAGASYATLAVQFGISVPTVAQIVTRKTWRHIG